MSTRNLIDAIASGSALDIESAFEDTMAEKVSVQIEAKRLQIAQTMFTTEEVDLDEEQLDEEQLDETPKVDAGLSGREKKKARETRGTNDEWPSAGNTTGGQWRGKDSPSPYKDSGISKSGERKGLVKKSGIQRTKDEIKSRLNKEETEEQSEQE